MANCILLRRRFDGTGLTLSEIFSSLRKDSSSAGYSGMNTNDKSYSNYQYFCVWGFGGYNNEPLIVLSIWNGYISAYSVVEKRISPKSAIRTTAPSTKPGIQEGYSSNSSIWRYNNSAIFSETSNADYGGIAGEYGATIAAISWQNSGYSRSFINDLFSNITISRIAYRDSNTAGVVRTNDKSCQVYLTAVGSSVSFWKPDADSYTLLWSTFYNSTTGQFTNPCAKVIDGYLQLTSVGSSLGDTVYGGSIIGFS